MESTTVITLGFAAFAVTMIFGGWRAARWLQKFADGLKTDIRADINSVKDEFTASQEALTTALNQAKAEFERVVKDMGAAHQAFREKTIEEFRDLERDIAGFKLTVAQQYASKGDMQQSVQIILARIDGLHATIELLKQTRSQD